MVKIPRTLLGFSKDLRSRQTPLESRLWEHLKANNLGVKFKRQVVIGPYIFDFAAKRKKLLVEVDGFGHKNMGKIKDRQKLDYARKAGYKVLKFWNSDIERNLPEVVEKIYKAVK